MSAVSGQPRSLISGLDRRSCLQGDLPMALRPTNRFHRLAWRKAFKSQILDSGQVWFRKINSNEIRERSSRDLQAAAELRFKWMDFGRLFLLWSWRKDSIIYLGFSMRSSPPDTAPAKRMLFFTDSCFISFAMGEAKISWQIRIYYTAFWMGCWRC